MQTITEQFLLHISSQKLQIKIKLFRTNPFRGEQSITVTTTTGCHNEYVLSRKLGLQN
jgi:hypothetical protein